MKDVIIIGAGPCGLAVAIEAHNNNLDYLVLEKGGLVQNITQFPTYVSLFGAADDFEIGKVPFSLDYGAPRKKDLMRYYYKVVQHFGLFIHLYEDVIDVQAVNSEHTHTYTVSTMHQGKLRAYQTRNVVFATGFIQNPRSLLIEGEDKNKVLPLFTEAHYFANQKVVIVGTGHSGLEAIIDLLTVNAEITLIHRGDNLTYTPKRWMMAEVRRAIEEQRIEALFSSKLVRIDDDKVLIQTPDGLITKDNDFVLKLIGFQPEYKPLQVLHVAFDPKTGIPQHDEDTYETNVPGVYVAGVVAGGQDVNNIQISTGRFHSIKIIKSITRKLNNVLIAERG